MDAYADWILSWVNQQWDAYLMSFMFKPLQGKDQAVLLQMKDALDFFYSTFVTRAERNPRSKSAIGRLPILLCFPDLPVPKRELGHKQSIGNVQINDGLHWHGILLVAPSSRLRHQVIEHFRTNERIYVGPRSRLLTLDVEPITERWSYVAHYASKSISRSRFELDDTLIFPKSQSELTTSENSRPQKRASKPTIGNLI